jgi:NAD(P)-dependent dehydrogenase (short-subunit alcohol dehydrogenase family)
MHMELSLKEKVAFISGGASGIGAETARNFLSLGAKVVIGDVNKSKGQALVETLKSSGYDNIAMQHLDVTKEIDWHASIAYTQSTFGPLTTLVNSAGVSIPGSIEDISLEEFHHTTSINLDGTFLGCKAGLAAMKQNKGGSIINIASTLGHRGGAGFAAYNASKAAVLMLTRSIALHCAEQKYEVRINSVSPGAIHTEMVDGYVEKGVAAGAKAEDIISQFAAPHPMGRLGRASEVASAIVFLASDSSSFSTGIDIPVDGGYLC